MKKKTFPIRAITVIALFAALIAVCSWIQIPAIPIPFTMQTFAVFLTVYVLGTGKGFLSVAVYLLLGFAGLPVFSRFGSGIGVLAGPTGGYLIGFLFTVIVTGVLLRMCRERPALAVFSMLAGLLTLYVFGTGWFFFMCRVNGDPTSLPSVLKASVLPFVLPDTAKIMLAILIGLKIKPVSDKYLKPQKSSED